jgi:hypothetical protein
VRKIGSDAVIEGFVNRRLRRSLPDIDLAANFIEFVEANMRTVFSRADVSSWY